MTDFEEYLLLEQKVKGVGDPTIDGVPIWKLVRTQFRWKYRNTRPFTVSPNIQIWTVVKNSCASLVGLIRILCGRKKYENVFFPHPRLFFVNGKYMERFSDSLIESPSFQGNTIILERHQNGIHKQPRYHSELVVYLDMIDNLTKVLKPIVKIWVRKKYKNPVHDLYETLDYTFHLNDKSYIGLFYNIVTQFIVSRWLIKPVIKCISPQRVFFAPRGTYDYAVSLCKKAGITAIELEHGIVLGKTDLYTGSYDDRIDPDYFFVFGADNVGEQYGIPMDRVVNVGFPFKNHVYGNNHVAFGEEVSLVISEPRITDRVINVLIDIIRIYPMYVFHIRCHPQERLSTDQLDRISEYENIKVVDNTIESFTALVQYQTVIGEISSVLFEAMSLHKKVGRLNFGGLVSKETESLHGGTIINSPQDFDDFMKSPYSGENDSKELYSDFQPEALRVIGI